MTISPIHFIGEHIQHDTILYTLVYGLFILLIIIFIIEMIFVRQYNKRLQANQVELANEKQLFKEIALTDTLTNICNRQGFDAWRETFSGTQIQICYFDIDYFKKVNDTLGHAQGDDVLINFAQLLNKHFTNKGLVVRWGGEEFIVLLPHTSGSEAYKLASVFQSKLAEESSHSNWPQAITCSVGISEAENTADISDALQRADKLLYKAKMSGRNCIIS